MAFQFQSIGALSVALRDNLAVSLIDIGLLVGLYLAPGIVIAIMGGTLASWIGDKRTVAFGLGLMVLGGLILSFATGLDYLAIGRIVSGIGGVIINVVMTKMVIDWFADKELSTALAIFITTWPLGIAMALLILPALVSLGGLSLAWHGATLLNVVALVMFVWAYQAPDGEGQRAAGLKITSLPWKPLIFAGLVWALYNSGLGLVFSFGPVVLEDRGVSMEAAGGATSLFMIAACISVPLGGWLADRWKAGSVLIWGCIGACVLLLPLPVLLPIHLAGLAFFVAGFFCGLCGGPIIGLPAQVLNSEQRVFGSGIFFAIYYALMMVTPAGSGFIAEQTLQVESAFWLAGSLMVTTILSYWGFVATRGQSQSASR